MAFLSPGISMGPRLASVPTHTVVPGGALRDQRLYAVFGVVGGAMQPQGQVQILCRLLAGKERPEQVLSSPRWRLEGSEI